MTFRSETQRVGAPTFAPSLPVLTPSSPNQTTRLPVLATRHLCSDTAQLVDIHQLPERISADSRRPSLDPVHNPYPHPLTCRGFLAPSGVDIRREAKP